MRVKNFFTFKQTFYFLKMKEFRFHPDYFNLKIIPENGKNQREVGLLRELSHIAKTLQVISYQHMNTSILKEVVPFFEYIYFDNNENTKLVKIEPNTFVTYAMVEYIRNIRPIVFCERTPRIQSFYTHSYHLSDSMMWLYVPDELNDIFQEQFKYYLNGNELVYDNLIHLTMIVKNGGETFRQVLEENMPFIDEWTILDTGSTDNTVQIIQETLVGKKKGTLYQEPFINFRESRNRCLDLAGKTCTFNIMLDDTYILRGDVRDFLTEIRGDTFGDSYSLYIKSDDVEYTSNRITRSEKGLRYIYKMHEVIQDKNNTNVIVPMDRAYIFDVRSNYMEDRTMARKEYDLRMLFEMLEEEPTVSRHLYYIAQTYNLLKDYENAYKYFELRAYSPHKGFHQEIVDSLFEMARIANFQLNKDWKTCHQLYMNAYEADPTRPDALYFIGIHYYLEKDYDTSYEYMKKGFILGYPIDAQFSLKPTLSYHFLPKFFTELCYYKKDYKNGEASALLFLQKNANTDLFYKTMASWYMIHSYLGKMSPLSSKPIKHAKPVICYVADGGWSTWSGKDILTKGVGGSETYIIEMARYVQASGLYDVVVFCNCEGDELFEGVEYKPLLKFFDYVSKHEIEHCIISRYSEYVPVALEGTPKNVHMVLHDLGPTGNIIPIHKKLKTIFCLTEWHVSYFLDSFPQFKYITKPFYYGIDPKFLQVKEKIANKFIYSSFPNRGLLPLLKMWSRIKERYSDATLHIYSDVNGKWANENYPTVLQEIRDILETKPDGVFYHGWVSKKELADSWSTASIWMYPCTFMETFCLTALECASSKTLVVCNDLAALQNTVRDRGLVIPGDVNTSEWQEEALRALFETSEEEKRRLIEKNYEWAQTMSWKQQAERFIKQYLS
jgi:tetratricopeptide (TPR) repeat protein